MLGGTPLGYQQIVTVTTSTALTVPDGTTVAVIQVESEDVRWRDDNVAPTTSVGYLLAAGAEMSYASDPTRLRFIETTVGAKLNVVYYR